MKNKESISSYLFTPFKFVAGKESLFIGVAVLALLFVFGYWNNVHFDGVLDTHFGCLTTQSSPAIHALYQLIAWFSLVVVFFPMAKTFSQSSVRLIDMVGTLAVARFPLIILALWGFNPDIHICMENINPFDTEAVMAIVGDKVGTLMISGLLSLVVAVWYIVVLYNAYSVSANLKGARAGWTFAAALILSEIISKIILHYL